MRRASWIWMVAILGIFSCEQEEFITDRTYPFLESISVSDVDETGATVNFEVKANAGAIDEYGLEYIETEKLKYNQDNPVYYTVSGTGSPGEALVAIRLEDRLVKGINYSVRPFARYGDKTVYGDVLLFDSQGVRPPLITEVSDSELTQFHTLTISGKYFNPSPEYLEVKIPELEGIFTVEILEQSSTQIKIKVWLSASEYTLPQGKFDLIVTSGGKSTVLQDYFSIVLPKIETLSDVEGFVGQSFDVYFNKLTSLSILEFRLLLPGSGYYPLHPTEIAPNTLRFSIGNLPPGDYTFSLSGRGFSDEYPQKIKVVNSWAPFKDRFPISTLYDWNWVGVGDEMLFWKNEIGDFQKFYSLPLNAEEFEPLPPLPNNQGFRGNYLIQAVQNRYLYFGLGPTKDFSRFDTQTRQWETLSDFPFGSIGVEKSFYFQGKIYIQPYGGSNFVVYDTNSNAWTWTSIEIPEDFKGTLYQDSNGEGVYYVPREQNQLIKYVPGVSREVVADLPGYSSSGTHYVSIMGNEVFLFHGAYEYFRVNLGSREVFPVQTLNGQQNLVARPWVTSKGMMMAFPKYQHDNEMMVYNWIGRY
ncbi:hypothetical protein [Algoriphagus sp. A40]|uniref:hypothetical protein n=1 Tax=Algoriphagus sp. A40 TaxID=1945863 RepID=UPI0009853696|nr:hypothetical protein [Algoriphagus sp. A40]OOG76757.1 hypothetical protein B0E43_07145 [Algoriphagus sp. A40]